MCRALKDLVTVIAIVFGAIGAGILGMQLVYLITKVL